MSFISSNSSAQCRLLNEDFNTNPLLSATNLDGAWYPDRYQPAGFASDAGRLKISISAADGAQLRPGGFSSAFYNTQGRKFNQCGGCVKVVKADIYIPSDWATKHRRTDMWATAFDISNVVSDFPIMGFANVDGLSPTLRYWNGAAWVNIGGLVYNTWITLEASISGANIIYKVNGATVATIASAGAIYYGNIIMQAYNFNDNTLGASYDPSANNNYDAFWDNLITTGINGNVVTNTNTGETFCSIQSAIDDPETLSGHQIVASAGSYNELLTINKNLVFKGQGVGIAGTGVRPVNESVLLAPVTGSNRLINLVGAVNVEFDGFLMDGKNIVAVTQPNQSLTLKNNILELDFSDSDNNIYFSSTQLSLDRNFFKAINGTNTTGGSSHIFMGGGVFNCTNNKFTSVDAINDYTVTTTSLPVWLNISTNTTSAAITNNEFSKIDIGILLASNASGVNIQNNDFDEAKRATYTMGTSFGAGIAIFNTLTPSTPIYIRNNNFKNSETAIRTSSTGAGQVFPAASLLSILNNSFTNISSSAIRVSSDFSTSTNKLSSLCNWFSNVSGPNVTTNPGGTGNVIFDPGNQVFYKNWLFYGTDASAALVFQLPTSITATAATNTSAAVNNYRLLSNAVGCLVDNQTLTLSGNFNFSNSTANAAWARGNDGLSGTDDDYSVKAPANVNGATITAASLGSATITGVGDDPGVNLEGFLYFDGGDNKNWTISNLRILDFDMGIGMFNGAGGIDAFERLNISNNYMRIPLDLNTVVAPLDVNQNIGIHYSFGANQTIANNTFDVEGDGASSGTSYSTSIVMQSNTSGGAVYDGLKIKDNTINVTGDPDVTDPAVIRGIWENGHNTDAAIEISGNIFINTSPSNTANLNRQNAFWVTSRSGAVKKVEYKNNEVTGFKEGLAWLGGLYTGNTPPNYETGAFPVEVKNNKFDATLNAVTVRKSAGSTNAGSPGYMENNSFTNFVPGGLAIKNEGTGNAQSVCNWYGTTSFPFINTLNSGPVYITSILNSGTDGSPATGFQPSGTCMLPPVHNVTQNLYYTTIQLGVNGANNGDSITVISGTYNEQVLVNKSVTLNGIGATQPIVDFTGTVSGKPTLFDVSVDGVTINNFNFNVDLSKLRSAVIASGADIDNIAVTNNLIGAYGTPAGSYGDRNAVSVNYGGTTNYRVATGGVNSITFTGNTVNGTGPGSYFRSGISADEAGGTFSNNTLQTINHDVLVRFANNGAVTISNNNFNGGGVELSDQNAAAGTLTVSGNTFTGAGAPNTAMLRVKNNYNSIPHIVSGNTFNTYDWAVSSENMNSITFNNNTFNTAVATARAIVVNTKSLSSNSNTIVQVPVGATMTNNNFNGTGTGLSFLNHDSDNDTYGTFTIGTVGNENNFAATLSSFITFDGQTGTSTGSTFPIYPGTGGWPTTMACWDQDINMQNNRLDVGAGLQLPIAMNFAQRTALEAKLTHDPDNSCLGLLVYFLPVHNLTQNTYYVTIQAGINAANSNDVIECAEWTFNERVTIDKSLTLQGIDSSTTIITGTGLVGTGNGITINNSVTNVTIQKLTVKNFAGASGNANGGIYAIGGNNNLVVDLVGILNNVGGSGFYANGPVNGVAITRVTSTGHTVGARGIVIWNGLKQNINISNNHVYGNNCCGIELQDGSASGVTMNNNNVHDNGDNGMSAVGLEGPGVNVLSGNTIINNGRFGMEIKNPNGSGANSGAGSIVITNNIVSRTIPIVDARDIAGIAVFRRSVSGGNVDVPYGVQVNNNSVAGYTQPTSSDGFGILLEGINHTATGNTLNGNDVGIQRQAGHLPYPGDGDQSNLADTYFGRGNSPVSCGITISGSIYGNILANGDNTRDVGNVFGMGIVANTNTGRSYCSIQAAINDPLTLNGHTITASAGTYNEDVVVNKPLTITGAGYATTIVSGPIDGGGATFSVQSPGVIIDGFTVTRDGNNVAQWNLALNSAGVAIQSSPNSAEVRNCNIVGNRTGIDINNSNGNNIHNNIIDNNRTGMILRNQTNTTNVQQNFITNNWTAGVLFLDGSGGTNSPSQQALTSTFNNNSISGNWYGDVVDRQSGGSLPAPGTNIKNFECNWYGVTPPVYSTSNSTEPGYAGQIPVVFGGTAVPPGGQPNILGPAAANIDFITWLVNGTDNAPATIGFQPVPGSCTGTGPVINTRTSQTYVTIQSAIDHPLTLSGDTLVVSPGTYPENVIVSKSLTILGPNAVINACSGTRVTEAVVVPALAAISSGEIFHIAASNVTISGFTINGDNTAITSGYSSTNGADIDAAEGVTVYETGINNLTVNNNIIKNLSYFGVTLYDYPAGVPSSGHVISNNKIMDLGTYDAGSGIDFWGGGVLLYNNQYAAVNNNCMTNVRLGVQTGNFYGANPGTIASQVISNNAIEARRRGIFHNLFYSAASTYTLSGNTITGLANANETASWDGTLIASMSVPSNSINNNINGAAVTAIPKTGISVWNAPVAPFITIDSISGVGLGINVNNFEGYPSTGSDAGPTSAIIDSVFVTGATIAGIRVNDNTANSSNANTVAAEIRNSTITGGATGIMVFGPQASANIHDNTSSINGAVVGIDIDSATVNPLYRNRITGNGTGLRVRRNGVLGLTTENFITNNTSGGIQIDATAGAIGNINNNDISGNSGPGFGINNLSAPTVNATCNWWGASGGNALLAVVGGVGTSYAPWIHTGVDAQPGTNGFQPAGTCSYDDSLYVNDGVNTGNFYTTAVGSDANPGVPNAPFRTISKAIAVAKPTGNTVWVDPGHYAENIVVNKEISIKGRRAGANITPRFAAFVSLKADTMVESVITTPVSNPLNNPNDLVKVVSNNVTLDGFILDGNNPTIPAASTVLDNLSLDIDARRGITNIDVANGSNPVNNLVIKNNIIQNVAQRGISLSNNGPVSTGILIDSNLIRNYGWDPVNGGQAVILFTNAYANITNNTIDVTDNNIGLHLQNFYSNGTMNWANNNVTVGQDAIGIHANLFYAPAGVLNIQNNTVNARAGVTGASDNTWGINVWSVQVGSTVNVLNNTFGNTGGELSRGINLWNLPTSNLVTVSGGTVARSLVGINLDNVDPYFGVGSNTMVNITGNPNVTAVSGQTGIRARSATVNAVAPGGSVTLNLNNATVNATGTGVGVAVVAPSAGLNNTATVYLTGSSIVNGGSTTPVLINGDQSQLYAGTSNITAPSTGANNAIQFTGITNANSRENLIIAGGTTINMNANTLARAFAAPQFSIVEMSAASGWSVPSRIAGGLQPVWFDGRVKFTNGILSTVAVADTIEFGNNAFDIMTGANPEKANSYILGRAKMLSRSINNGAIDMLGANLAAEAGAPANVGNLVIARTTTASGGINPLFPANNSIRTVWNINPTNITSSRTNVQYRYLNIASNLNSQNPASIFAYRNTGGVWNKISASLSSTLVGDVYTTSSFQAPSFSPWTLSSQATATLPDLTPTVLMDVLSFNTGVVGVDRDFIVILNETAGVPTSGLIQFRVSKTTAFNISFVPTSGVSNVFGGTPNTNSDFTFSDPGGSFYLVTTSVSIPANGSKIAGFRINRKPGIPSNTTQSVGITVLPGSGGDNTFGNNLKSMQVTAN